MTLPKMMIGSSSGAELLTDLETRLGFTLDAFREYSSNWTDVAKLKTTLAADKAAGRASLYSIKPIPASTTTARWKTTADALSGVVANASVTNGIKAIADAINSSGQDKLYFTVHHEPNGDGGDPAQFRRMHQEVYKYLKANVKISDFYMGWCPTGWLWLNPNPGIETPDAYYPGDAFVDVQFVDAYGDIGGGTRSFENTFAKIVAWVRAKNKPLIVFETGLSNVNPQAQADWLATGWDYIKKNLDVFIGITWWSSGKYTLASPTAAVMKRMHDEAELINTPEDPQITALKAQVGSLSAQVATLQDQITTMTTNLNAMASANVVLQTKLANAKTSAQAVVSSLS
jgi:hypothetical protein